VIQARRVLVTGAGGFIGRWSVAPLLEKGFEVHAVLSGTDHRTIPAELQGASVLLPICSATSRWMRC